MRQPTMIDLCLLCVIVAFMGFFAGGVPYANDADIGKMYMQQCIDGGYTHNHCYRRAKEELEQPNDQ